MQAASLTALVQCQLMVFHRFSFGELGPRLSKSILEYVILTWSSFLPYKSDGVVYFNTVDEPPARPRAAAARLVALFAFDDKLLSKLLRYDPGRLEHIACHNYAASLSRCPCCLLLLSCARLLTFDVDVMCLSVSGCRTLPAAAGAAEAASKSRFRVRHFAGVASIQCVRVCRTPPVAPGFASMQLAPAQVSRASDLGTRATHMCCAPIF